MPRCTSCEEMKPYSAFDTGISKGYKYVLGRCRDCERERKRINEARRREAKEFDVYVHDASKSPCLSCQARYTCQTECSVYKEYVINEPIVIGKQLQETINTKECI